MIDVRRANTYTLMPMERALKEFKRQNRVVVPSKRKSQDVSALFKAIASGTEQELDDKWGDLRMKRTLEAVNVLHVEQLDVVADHVDEDDVTYVKTKALIELLQEGSVNDNKAEQKGLVKLLTQRGCLIMCMYHGIGTNKMTHQEVADDLNMSRDGVIRSIKRNMSKIKTYLEAI